MGSIPIGTTAKRKIPKRQRGYFSFGNIPDGELNWSGVRQVPSRNSGGEAEVERPAAIRGIAAVDPGTSERDACLPADREAERTR
ncbi:MAG TPA: hypothetical protein VMD74_03195 [Candidatus Methylomirabilis sp.]|nr:hypothetical protein [Candidatus Methylomirabilis sp.]